MIPATIIQTAPRWTKEIELGRDRLLRLHPGWKYLFFDDDAAVAFLRRHYPSWATFMAQACARPIQVVDLFRYLAVHHHGGFYLDTDVELHTPLHRLTKLNAVFPRETWAERDTPDDPVLLQRGAQTLLGQYAFGARRHSRFLARVCHYCASTLSSPRRMALIPKNTLGVVDSSLQVYHSTGPVAVTLAYLDCPDSASEVTVLEPPPREERGDDPVWFGTFGVHRAVGSWKKLWPDIVKHHALA